MRMRIPLVFKILFPFLVISSLFGVILIVGADGLSPGLKLVSWAGVAMCIVFLLVQLIWFRSPVRRIRNLVSRLTEGDLPSTSIPRSSDEFGDLQAGLAEHVEHMRSLTAFAEEIASGDFSGTIVQRGERDEISKALLSLKHSLEASVRETESRRKEEEHRTWTAQGLAKFSGLFREVEDDLEQLAGELTKELVAYTEADVGGLFITEENPDSDRPLLVLKGSYAFDRQKHVHRIFEFGEGLVGRAALEKEFIYLTELPPETLKIRSGLGEDLPSSLLLVPLLLDNQVLGVIELASLGNLPAYQVEFVQQLADALATTVAKVEASLQTRKQAEAHLEFSKREEELLKEIERLKKS